MVHPRPKRRVQTRHLLRAQNGDDDQFLCFTDPSTPVVKRLFKKIDATPQLTRLVEALQQILATDPEIGDVVWTEPE